MIKTAISNRKESRKIIQKNKAAFFHYEILEKLECGICLKGTEIKSIRQGKVNIQNAFVLITEHWEAEIFHLEVSTYNKQKNSFLNHNSKRVKKLLLHKKEIKKLHQKQKQKNLTIVVLSIYFKHGLAKLEIALAKGKKLFDKRHAIKERDEMRNIDRQKKSFQNN